MGRVIIAAAGSGSGKTLITCGLMQCLVEEKKPVRAYKCGPDYIDPMFHRKVIGIPSENLDSFFCSKAQLNRLLGYGQDQDISIIEGVMGIYDGLGGISQKGSTYDIACMTDTPVILVLNAHGMGRTVISVIKGITGDDKEGLIKGVILNNISKGYYSTIAPVIEEETGIDVVGYLPKLTGINIESRHLGLMLPGEIEDLHTQLARLSQAVRDSIDIDCVVKIADAAGEIQGDNTGADCVSIEAAGADDKKGENTDNNGDNDKTGAGGTDKNTGKNSNVTIAVASDEVFCFIYEDNLRMLRETGVKVIFFSPLHDKSLPDGISGIYIPGGYPELRLAELCANDSMRRSIYNAISSNMPVIAECGGFMYLHDSITGEDGTTYKMVGVIDGNCYNTGKLVRFGYVDLQINGECIKGHEFHYYDSTAPGSDCVAVKPSVQNAKSWEYGYARKDRILGYPHMYFASCGKLISDWVQSVKDYHKNL